MKTIRQRLIDEIFIAINRADINKVEPKKMSGVNLFNEKQDWGFSSLDKNNPQHQEIQGLLFEFVIPQSKNLDLRRVKNYETNIHSNHPIQHCWRRKSSVQDFRSKSIQTF